MKIMQYGLRILTVLTALCVTGLLLQTFLPLHEELEIDEERMHFSIIMPELESSPYNMPELVERMAQEYDLDLEFHPLSTVLEQKQMLRLLAKTEVEGVLLWPISSNDEDYAFELKQLCEAEIPIVIVDRDVAQGIRNSFIGSGISSDLLVLSQSIKELEYNETFVVGNQSGSGSNQVVELLFFSRTEPVSEEIQLPQDKKLRQLALNIPEGYFLEDYWRLEGENAKSLMLKYELASLFASADAPGLFFSLDDSLSTAAISAKQTAANAGNHLVRLLCYGEKSKHEDDLNNGCLNGLVTSRPEVSVYIGIRYLRDICRGFWVPETMDSGIDFQKST